MRSFLDIDYLDFCLRLLKFRILYPMGFRSSILLDLFALFILEFLLAMVTGLLIPLIDYLLIWPQFIIKRNKNIYKIDEPLSRGQIRRELKISFIASIVISAITAPIHYGLEMNCGKIYLRVLDFSENIYIAYNYIILQVIIFFIISDFSIYWIHRALHSNLLYVPLHKLHHSFVSISPFSAFAFNPLDAWLQSWPYWFTPYLIPMHKLTHLILLILVTIWTTSIHDRIIFCEWKFINGAGHHYVHHRDFQYNYGQYFTICDRTFGTFKEPVNFSSENEKFGSVYDKKSK